MCVQVPNLNFLASPIPTVGQVPEFKKRLCDHDHLGMICHRLACTCHGQSVCLTLFPIFIYARDYQVQKFKKGDWIWLLFFGGGLILCLLTELSPFPFYVLSFWLVRKETLPIYLKNTIILERDGEKQRTYIGFSHCLYWLQNCLNNVQLLASHQPSQLLDLLHCGN